MMVAIDFGGHSAVIRGKLGPFDVVETAGIDPVTFLCRKMGCLELQVLSSNALVDQTSLLYDLIF